MGFINKSKDFPRNSPNLNPSSSPEKTKFQDQSIFEQLVGPQLGHQRGKFPEKKHQICL